MKLILGNKPEEKEGNVKKVSSRIPAKELKIAYTNKDVYIAKDDLSVLKNSSIVTEEPVADQDTQTVDAGIITPAEKFFTGKQFLYEDIQKRSRNGKYYVSNDGTAVALYQKQAVHYFDSSDNVFKDIDNSLQDKGNTFDAAANDFEVQFNKSSIDGKVFELTKKDCKVSFIYQETLVKGNTKIANNLNLVRGKNEVILKNIKDNTDIQYIVEPDRVKENIVINKKSDKYEYNFDINIENMTAAASDDGKTLQLKNVKSGEVVFFIPVPFMADANGQYCDNVWYEIESLKENTLNLKVFADPNWLDAANRVFPVTISPQIVSEDTSLFNYKNLSGKDSGSVNNIHVLTVKKSLLNLEQQKISKVILKLLPDSGAAPDAYHSFDITNTFIKESGDLNFEIMKDFVLKPLPLDIVKPVKPEETELISPKPPIAPGGSAVAPVDTILEVEYLTNDDSVLPKESFSLAGGIEGTLNLSTGEFVTVFPDVSVKSSALACKISHVYKKNSANYGCGKNWRLNLHQTLVKNTVENEGVDYIYTDSDGEKHGFMETYYYLDQSNKKVTVDKSAVTAKLDGSLWYKKTRTHEVEVFKDQRTATGLELKLSTKMEGFKNAENLEQRQKEQKQAEEYLDSMEKHLKEQVVMNIFDGTISCELKNFFTDNVLSNAAFNTFVSKISSGVSMVLSKGEAMQYASLLLQQSQQNQQKKQMNDQLEMLKTQKNCLVNNKNSLNNNLSSLYDNIKSLENRINSLEHNKYSLDTQLQTLEYQYDALKTNEKVLVSDGNKNKSYYEDQKRDITNQMKHIKTVLFAESNIHVGTKYKDGPQRVALENQKYDVDKQVEEAKTQKEYILKKQITDLQNQITDIQAQMNDIADKQIPNIKKSISSVEGQIISVRKQIDYILDKSYLNSKELKRIFKEYVNSEFEVKKMKKQIPVSYLSDGNLFLGFNEAGKLCEMTDNYDNRISVEYDNSGRISKVYDGKKASVLKYNFYGQLISVTDPRGRRTTYTYSSVFESAELKQVTYADGNTLGFYYLEKEISAVAASADKTRSLLSYSSNKLEKITNQSDVIAITDEVAKSASPFNLDIPVNGDSDAISKIEAARLPDRPVKIVTISAVSISYTENECVINTDGKTNWYIMDRLGNLVGGYSTLADGMSEDRLYYNYFDRSKNWSYSVKETGDPIKLPDDFQIEIESDGKYIFQGQALVASKSSQDATASGGAYIFKSSGELQTFLSKSDLQACVPVNASRTSAVKKTFSPAGIIRPGSQNTSGSDATESAGTLIGRPAVTSKEIPNITAFTTIAAGSLPAGKTEFMFSAYAIATSKKNTDMRFCTSFRSSEAGKNPPKFEIVAEVNYADKPAQIFVASFDYKDKNMQFCALPVTLDKSLLSDLKSIVLKFVYTAKGFGLVNFTGFRFAPCEWEYKTFDQFKNMDYSETNTVLLNASRISSSYEKTFMNYSYDQEHRLILKRIAKTTDIGQNKKITYAASKHYYNDFGSIARTENYVEGEEGTTGILVKENIYDDKGRRIKEVSYNTLDSTAKNYIENEYHENGQIKAEIDSTGENITVREYAPGTDDIQTIINPAGGKFSYGRDFVTGVVTGITQSTEDGEPNSVETKYTCGLVTRLKSGLNTVNYEYDAKRRKSKVLLNGTERVNYSYDENSPSGNIIVNEIEFEDMIADKMITVLKDDKQDVKTETITDKRGNIIRVSIDGITQYASSYNADKCLVKSADDITGSTLSAVYDNINKRMISSARTAGTKAGYEYLSGVSEKCAYNDYGEVKERAFSIDGSPVLSYLYAYNDNAARNLKSISLPNGLLHKPQTDANGRDVGKLLTDSEGNNKFGEYFSYRKVADHTTKMISSIRYGKIKDGQYVIGDKLNYKYDVCNNISEIWENGKLVTAYAYDKLQRLVREDNMLQGKSWFYSYDNNGNILSKKEADYTKKPVDEIMKYNYEKLYFYDGDKLMDCGGEKFTYDGLGNPLTYRNHALKWNKGRLLEFNGIGFEYDGYGRRVKKGNTVYTLDINGQLLRQSDGTDTLEFIYDDGGLSGIKHGNNQYVYRKNVQGDITHIFQITGELAAYYIYDAWGNHTVIGSDGNTITDAAHIGNLNPFRYRSYLYDRETKLYFLQTRYYDPEIGRFISQDSVSYLEPGMVNGLNLYAYCGNNCVMRIDDTGCSWSSFWRKVGNIFKKAVRFIAGLVLAVVGFVIGVTAAISSIVALIPGLSTIVGPVTGAITQFGITLGMYGGFMMASVFDSQIDADMKAIGWNPFNINAQAVADAEKASFYKGMPVVKYDTKRSSSIMGVITLDKGASVDIVKHEWGHGLQQLILGQANYLITVGIPSWKKWGSGDYYDKPWEIMAEMTGGVNNSSDERTLEEMYRGENYLKAASLFGVFGLLF